MKVAPVLSALATGDAKQTLVHTGQHYDANLSDAILHELGIPSPDVNLGVGSGSHAQQTGQVMIGMEQCLLERRPDIVVVYGDVNSTVGSALAATKLGIQVAHVEAGLRSRDRSMPEEINRVVVDRLADWLYTPSEDANDNLLSEGCRPESIQFVGNVMIDTLVRLLPIADPQPLLERFGLTNGHGPKPFILTTLHRASNVDDAEMLHRLMEVLSEISTELPVVFPVHPRTRARLDDTWSGRPGLLLTEPLTYVQFLGLQREARVVITDSGGIQEETTYLGVPCLTVRDNTERPVTITEGTNRLVGRNPERLRTEVSSVLQGANNHARIPTGWDGRAGSRIAEHLLSIQ
jgi:UDP-N-acetylglucosamine 2-epimerase (non-hydrolysing)